MTERTSPGVGVKTDKIISIGEIMEWEEKQGEGFHGILKRPDGQEGFLSIIRGRTSWTPIGEGQDPVEVMEAAKRLHDALSSEGSITADLLCYYGEKVERLSRPKVVK